jgi:hypothetical protein
MSDSADSLEHGLPLGKFRSVEIEASARGAINGLIAEVIEDYVRMRVVDPLREPDEERAVAARELIDVVHCYLK